MRNHKLFYGSSYDRGLSHLLKMWPSIKEKFPDATLDICYGWNNFVKGYANNEERMSWKDKMDALMKQDGIKDWGRVGQKQLSIIRKQCGIWAYPTDFDETFCITAVESQLDGLVPCVIERGALSETVGAGVKLKGDIYTQETVQEYKKALIELMSNEELWKQESEKGKEFAKKFYWEEISEQWIKQF